MDRGLDHNTVSALNLHHTLIQCPLVSSRVTRAFSCDNLPHTALSVRSSVPMVSSVTYVSEKSLLPQRVLQPLVAQSRSTTLLVGPHSCRAMLICLWKLEFPTPSTPDSVASQLLLLGNDTRLNKSSPLEHVFRWGLESRFGRKP